MDVVGDDGVVHLDQRTAGKTVVVDVEIPFFSMVVLLVKVALASIPAVIILAVLGAVVFGILGGVGGIALP